MSAVAPSPTLPAAKLRRYKPSRAGKKRAKKDGNHVSRPMNAFMVWQKEQRPIVQQRCPHLQNHMVSIELGRLWKSRVSDAQKAAYARKAARYAEIHRKQHPDYKYRPKTKGRAGKASETEGSSAADAVSRPRTVATTPPVSTPSPSGPPAPQVQLNQRPLDDLRLLFASRAVPGASLSDSMISTSSSASSLASELSLVNAALGGHGDDDDNGADDTLFDGADCLGQSLLPDVDPEVMLALAATAAGAGASVHLTREALLPWDAAALPHHHNHHHHHHVVVPPQQQQQQHFSKHHHADLSGFEAGDESLPPEFTITLRPSFAAEIDLACWPELPGGVKLDSALWGGLGGISV